MITDDQYWRGPVLVQYDERRRVATAQQRDASRERVFAVQFHAGTVGHGPRVYLLEGRSAERRSARRGAWRTRAGTVDTVTSVTTNWPDPDLTSGPDPHFAHAKDAAGWMQKRTETHGSCPERSTLGSWLGVRPVDRVRAAERRAALAKAEGVRRVVAGMPPPRRATGIA